MEPVVGKADEADFPLGFGFQHGLIESCAVSGLGAEGGVMELVDVDIVGFQKAQAGFQILPEAFHSSGGGLGGDYDFVPDIGQGQAHFFFAVTVRTGGVEEGDARIIGFAQELPRIVRAYPLDGQGAEGIFVGHNPSASQCNS